MGNDDEGEEEKTMVAINSWSFCHSGFWVALRLFDEEIVLPTVSTKVRTI